MRIAVSTGWTVPPLSLNDRHGVWRKADLVKMIRRRGQESVPRGLKPGHVTVSMVWYVNDKRRRDVENPVATLKPFCDGLVDAGLVPDDTPQYMTKLMPEIKFSKTVPAEVVFYIDFDDERMAA